MNLLRLSPLSPPIPLHSHHQSLLAAAFATSLTPHLPLCLSLPTTTFLCIFLPFALSATPSALADTSQLLLPLTLHLRSCSLSALAACPSSAPSLLSPPGLPTSPPLPCQSLATATSLHLPPAPSPLSPPLALCSRCLLPTIAAVATSLSLYLPRLSLSTLAASPSSLPSPFSLHLSFCTTMLLHLSRCRCFCRLSASSSCSFSSLATTPSAFAAAAFPASPTPHHPLHSLSALAAIPCPSPPPLSPSLSASPSLLSPPIPLHSRRLSLPAFTFTAPPCIFLLLPLLSPPISVCCGCLLPTLAASPTPHHPLHSLSGLAATPCPSPLPLLPPLHLCTFLPRCLVTLTANPCLLSLPSPHTRCLSHSTSFSLLSLLLTPVPPHRHTTPSPLPLLPPLSLCTVLPLPCYSLRHFLSALAASSPFLPPVPLRCHRFCCLFSPPSLPFPA